MERLTQKRRGRNVIPLMVGGSKWELAVVKSFDCPGQFLSGDAADRLAAYEDTGLAPEEIKEFLDEIENRFLLWVQRKYGISNDRFLDIVRAEQDGRLVVLPCKVGDTVYFPVADRFDSAEVDHFEIFKDKVMLAWAQYDRSYECTELWDMDEIDCAEIGKAVFLTRQEAEAALERREDRT